MKLHPSLAAAAMAALLACPGLGHSQAPVMQAQAVAACPAVSAAYTVSRLGQVSMDPSGNLCGTVMAGSWFATPSSSFIRPNNTTAYSIGNLVANDPVAANVVPLSWQTARTSGGSSWHFAAKIRASNLALIGATFVVHVYKSPPTFANGDGGAFATNEADWVCDFTVVMNGYAFTDFVDGRGVPNQGNACMGIASVRTAYGALETRTAFTPTAASTYAVTLEVVEN